MATARAASFLDKGGTGKTTTTGHFAAALAKDGHDVLAMDLAGKQGDLGYLFGLSDQIQRDLDAEDDWPNISTVFDQRWSDIADRSAAHATPSTNSSTNPKSASTSSPRIPASTTSTATSGTSTTRTRDTRACGSSSTRTSTRSTTISCSSTCRGTRTTLR